MRLSAGTCVSNLSLGSDSPPTAAAGSIHHRSPRTLLTASPAPTHAVQPARLLAPSPLPPLLSFQLVSPSTLPRYPEDSNSNSSFI
jgi:hypothetical protein